MPRRTRRQRPRERREDIAWSIASGHTEPAAVSVDTPAWVRDAVFYQIFPDRFAASERVRKPGRRGAVGHAADARTASRAATCSGSSSASTTSRTSASTRIYMTPIFQSASNHRYHTYDYFKVDPLLGGDAALRELLDRAHERGMRVVLDGVFNHTGRGFWPFHHILETGAASPYRDWFHLDPDVLEGHRLLTPYPPTRCADRGLARVQGVVGPAGPAEAQHRPPRRPRVPVRRSPSTGCASGSTAGAWTSRPRSTTRRSGRSSGAAAGRSGPTPTSSARSGRSRRTGSATTASMR